MDTARYRVIDLDDKSVMEAFRICCEELGDDYRTEADFRKCVGSPDTFCKVVIDEDAAACGFSISMIIGPERIDPYFKLPASAERDGLLSLRKIGVLDAAAVDRKKKGGGLGRMVAGASCARLADEGAEAICTMAWKDIHGVTNAGRILDGLGLRPTLEIKGYWNHEVSSPEGHHCPVCGTPPCRCWGVLYVKYL